MVAIGLRWLPKLGLDTSPCAQVQTIWESSVVLYPLSVYHFQSSPFQLTLFQSQCYLCSEKKTLLSDAWIWKPKNGSAFSLPFTTPFNLPLSAYLFPPGLDNIARFAAKRLCILENIVTLVYDRNLVSVLGTETRFGTSIVVVFFSEKIFFAVFFSIFFQYIPILGEYKFL